jgi:streptogrisin C
VTLGWTGQLIGVGSGHCLDIPDNDPFDGAPLQIAVCNTSSAQRWTFASDGTVRARGMCMDVEWGSTANGAAIQLGTCIGDTAQIFVLNQIGELVNQKSGKCVSVNDGSTDYGSQLSLWWCNGGSYQRWRR